MADQSAPFGFFASAASESAAVPYDRTSMVNKMARSDAGHGFSDIQMAASCDRARNWSLIASTASGPRATLSATFRAAIRGVRIDHASDSHRSNADVTSGSTVTVCHSPFRRPG